MKCCLLCDRDDKDGATGSVRSIRLDADSIGKGATRVPRSSLRAYSLSETAV